MTPAAYSLVVDRKAGVSLASLLASQPSATVVNVNDETVVGGILGVGVTVMASQVQMWITDRNPADVELDEAGAQIISAHATVDADVTLEVGWQLWLTDGRTYVVTGWPVHGNTPRGVHHLRWPCRRVASDWLPVDGNVSGGTLIDMNGGGTLVDANIGV